MKVTGIIAEYNPFHNGHLYQLREAVRLTECDYIVIVMSGNFVQRGAPSLADKHAKAEMALRCGADLVLELPVLYAASSAETFAAGAAALLQGLGVVTHLCFGSECGDIKALREIAAFLLEEPESYRTALKDFLKQGISYPNARAKAVSVCKGALPEESAKILASPNNILAIDYLKAILRSGSGMVPVTIQRIGDGYHEGLHGGSFSQPGSRQPPPSLSSALAIRQALQQGHPLSGLSGSMPPESMQVLCSYMEKARLLYADDFSSLLYYKLLTDGEQGYEKYLDVSQSLSDRIRRQLNSFTDYEGFCGLLKTKDMTYTRISRCLLHILLGIEKTHMAAGENLGHAPYARVLGFRRQAAPLLGAIGKLSSIPLVTKLADAEKSLSADAFRLLKLDVQSSSIYQAEAAARTGQPPKNEFSTPLVII